MTADEIVDYEAQLQAPDELDADAVTKYKMAAGIVNSVIAQIVGMLLHGTDVGMLCSFGDQLLHEKLSSVFAHGQVEKGPAFPACISVNNCASNFAPLEEGAFFIQNGDVVKVCLGAQIDGYIAVSAHTHVVVAPEASQSPTEGRIADVIAATHMACEVVQRMLRPGVEAAQISAAIARVAALFKCTPVHGNFICDQKRFMLEGTRVVWNVVAEDHEQSDFVIEDNDVYNVDIMMSTGPGKLRAGDAKPTIYARDLTKSYQMRMKASRALYAEVSERFPTMPFSIRTLDQRNTKLGMQENLTHGLLSPFPVMYEREEHIVAQFKFTAVVQERQTTRLVSHPLPYVHSTYEVIDPELLELLKEPVRTDGPVGM